MPKKARSPIVRPNLGAYREYAKTGSQRVSACIACLIDRGGVQQRESCEKGYSIYSGANEGKSDSDGSCSWWSWTSGLVELDQRAGVAGPASWCGWASELVWLGRDFAGSAWSVDVTGCDVLPVVTSRL